MSKKALPNPYPTVRQPKRSRTPENFPKMKHRARKRRRVDHLGSVHVSVVPVTHTFTSHIKRVLEQARRIALGMGDAGSAAGRAGVALHEMAPNLPPAPPTYAIPEQLPVRPVDEYSIAPLPRHLPTAVLNPNVRKRR
ncbi:hypothetical protein [Rhodococcus qingshengii]|uniref:hypothetical protein n=1 Tax=Rhodococcus qingshengii TaxID=334542 RepID=UPI001BEBFFC6|nr:hypothetical protein [Rhodococcus qingshengii]MBT2273862.1 hypothetical protein [Rhodococcus qingshengii]